MSMFLPYGRLNPQPVFSTFLKSKPFELIQFTNLVPLGVTGTPLNSAYLVKSDSQDVHYFIIPTIRINF